MALADVDTFIIVIMENRSFDHMLGYLNLPGAGQIALDGLSSDPSWLAALANPFGGVNYECQRLDPSIQTIVDPNHNWDGIEVQVNTKTEGGYAMGGFVESYAGYSQPGPSPSDCWHVMGYYDRQAVPTYDFFAHNFLTCDHWFCALPAGTQPNRLMAMSGTSSLFENGSSRIPHQDLVYEWLDDHGIPWRSYVWGDFLPFFALDWDRLPEILESLALGDGQWRQYDQFAASWASAEEMPSVIFIEPEYSEGLATAPNDDHSPTGIEPGQWFLRQVYIDVIANPVRWARTMMIVTYDEHGGFFDHVMPLDIPTTAGGHAFATTGLRVPAFIISPHVTPSSVYSGALDHTSILQLLADRFAPGGEYSPQVSARQASLKRLSQVLNPIQASASVPSPAPAPATVARTAPPAPTAPPAQLSANAQAFRATAQQALKARPGLVNHPNLAPLVGHMRREGLMD